MRARFATHPLEWLTILYLALPVGIFISGWLSPILALPLLYALSRALQRWRFSEESPQSAHGLHLSALALAMMVAWVTLSGAGGIGFQNWDYLKHNAVLSDLIELRWPVRYPSDEGDQRLAYSIGYYLPAALAGKVAGWKAALATQYFWTLVGALLGLLWFLRLSAIRRDSLGALLFIAIGGLDLAGWVILKGSWPALGDHLEHWTRWGFMSYSSNSANLFWAPQHAIPAWLATPLVLLHRREPRFADQALLCALVALWSPFVALGLLPFCKWPKLSELGTSLPALSLGAVELLFFQARTAPLGLSPLWNLLQSPLVWLCEFGVYSLLVLKFVPLADRKLFSIAIPTLIGSGLLTSSHYNDFTMRVSQPASLVLWLLIAGAFARHAVAKLRRPPGLLALALLLIAGSASFFQETWRSLARTAGQVAQPVPRSLHLLMPAWLPAQYLGSGESFFFRYIAK